MEGAKGNYYSGFDPKSVAGCTLWLDATDPNGNGTVPANGASISTWADKSGQNYPFSQATAGNQPTYSTTGFGNKGSIVFNGTSSYVFSSTFGSVLGGDDTPFSFFAIMKFTNHTSPAVQSLFNIWTGATTNGFHAVYVDNTGNPNKWQYIRRDAAGLNVGLQSSANISSGVTYLHTQIFKGTTVDGFLNGTQDANFTNASLNVATLGTTNSIGAIGILYRSTQIYPLNGEVGEILVYTGVLSAIQRQHIEGYLARKWGVQSSMPATHPYKSIPPVLRPFAPVDISGCALWLDATDISTITLSTSNVTQWSDKSGNGNHFTQATAARYPVYTSNAVNGNPAISFTGTASQNNSSLVLSNSTIVVPNTGYSILAVAKQNASAPSAYGYNYILKGHLASDYYLFFGSGPSGYFASFTGTTSAWNDVNTNTPSTNTRDVARIYEMVLSGNSHTPYYDGNAMTAKDSTGAASFTGIMLADTPVLNGGQCWNGYLCEILIYTTALTARQRQLVEGYLARKWGLQSSIVAGHPYQFGLPPLTSGFNPIVFSNCTLWLDGADRLSMTLAGSNVSQWNDKSGLGYHATQATSSQQPTFTVVNSRPGLFFVASSNTHLRNLTHTMNLSNFSVFLVTQQTAEPQVNSGFLDLTPTSGNAWGSASGFSIESGANNVPMKMSINSVNVFIPGSANPAPYSIYEFFRTGTSGIAYLNGTAGTGATLTTAATNTGYVIGTIYVSGGLSTTNDLDGYIHEIVIYSRQLSTAERQQMEGYLAWKWRLQGGLAGSHPYRMIKP